MFHCGACRMSVSDMGSHNRMYHDRLGMPIEIRMQVQKDQTWIGVEGAGNLTKLFITEQGGNNAIVYIDEEEKRRLIRALELA